MEVLYLKPYQTHHFPSLLLAVRSKAPISIYLSMARGWRRSMGIIESFVGNAMGGLTGPSNVASWMVAGTVAYFLWVKPLKREQQEAALIYGNRNRVSKPEE